MPCNETTNSGWVVATRVSSILAFNIPRETRPERTLDRAEKADQKDESRESALGRSKDTGCFGRSRT